MSRYINPRNPYVDVIYENEQCIEFETVGKLNVKVIVDKNLWHNYLSSYSWTAIKTNNRITIKTSINKQSKNIWRVIIENEFDELDYWGTTIDHINNNPLDNRLKNLRIYNAAILNSTNISSKNSKNDMQYIHKQGTNGYKVHYNLSGTTFYMNFSKKEYGCLENALIAAKKYRDEVVLNERQKVINQMQVKTRNIEFERGLKEKLKHGEKEEIISILKKYNISAL